MSGQAMDVAVVTGATGGIGKWIALGLARSGRHVVLIGRDHEKLEAASSWIRGSVPEAKLESRVLDLRSLSATTSMGEAIARDHERISLLVNNAGMFTTSRELTAEGRETVLAVNHLAPMVLSDALEKTLIASAPSRIVNVGSSTSDKARIDPHDLELTAGWGMVRAYARSKLAFMMSSFARAERLRGTGVVVNVVHPGAVATGLIRETGPIGLAWRLMAPFLLTEAQGADTPLHVATSEAWQTMTRAYAKQRRQVQPNRRAEDPKLIAAVEAASRALLKTSHNPAP